MSATASLSLCMIAKNEEAHLARCLASVRGLVDEIVFVDTGSSDRTIEIARSFGARIFTFTWRDDFSLARNFALAQATGDWILSLDADETIAARDHAAIRAILDRTDLNAVIVPQRHYLAGTAIGWQAGSGGYDEGAPYSGFVDVTCRRLFRNTPWLRFKNRVHEDLVSADPTRPLVQARGAWVIHHFGKVGDRDVLRAKGEAYLRIGARKIAEQPNDPQAHYELGVQHSELGNPAAALAAFEQVERLSPGFRDTLLQIALTHVHLGQQDQALAALRRASRQLPQFGAEIALEQGNVHRAMGNAAEARREFRRAIAINPAFAAAHVNLALLSEKDGQLEDALGELDRALAACPKHLDLRLLRARVRRHTGDDEGALADLAELGPHDAALRQRARLLTRLRRFAQARTCLAELREAADAELASLRGAVALGLGERTEAAALLQRSLDIQPTLEAARNLCTVLEAEGNRERALATAATALGLAPEDASALACFNRLAGPALGARASDGRENLTLFFYQPRSIAYDARTPRTRGLGGTESAIVYLAEALAQRGHHVVVFNNCDAPGTFDGVEYARWETMPARAVAGRPDVVVAVRAWRLIGLARLAPLQIFWTGDAYDQPFVESIARADARQQIDFLMLQSEWHAATFQSHHEIPAWRILRTRLGTAASTTAAARDTQAATARPRRLAYASTPFRGLDLLLALFPRIRAACPDAELDVFSSMQVYGMAKDEDRARHAALYRRAGQPGVNLVGSLPQLELAARLRDVRALAYPNHFAETFCIAAAEAQAAGCPVVTSRLGALPETVGDAGVCIPGDPRSRAYQDAFVNACVRLLIDDGHWRQMSERASARADACYRWPAIAAEWESLCRAALTVEAPVVQRIAVHLSAGRAGLALRMLERETPPADLPAAAWDGLRSLAAWRAGTGEAPSPAALQCIVLHVPSLRRAEIIEPALERIAV